MKSLLMLLIFVFELGLTMFGVLFALWYADGMPLNPYVEHVPRPVYKSVKVQR